LVKNGRDFYSNILLLSLEEWIIGDFELLILSINLGIIVTVSGEFRDPIFCID